MGSTHGVTRGFGTLGPLLERQGDGEHPGARPRAGRVGWNERGAYLDDWLAEAGALLFKESVDACAVFELLTGDQLRIVDGNAALARLLDVDVDALPGTAGDALYPVTERVDLAEKVRWVIEHDAPLPYRVTRELPNGRLVLDAKLFPLGDRRVLAYKRNITEERAAIREAQALEALTETGTWSWNAVERTLALSPELRRIFGLSSDEPATADRVLAAVHPDDRDRVTDAIRRALSDAGSDEVQSRLLRDDGEIREVCWRGRAVREPDGTLIRAFGTIQDVTERRALERREQDLRMAATEQMRAIELNDNVIQILARAWLALDLERTADTREAIEEAITHVREIMSELFETAKRARGGLRPGDLARTPAPTPPSSRR